MIVSIPNNFNRATMYSWLQSVLTPDGQPADPQIQIDLRGLRFVEPAGITALANTIEFLKSSGLNPELIVEKREPSRFDPIRYLDESGLLNRYLGHHLYPESGQPRDTMHPLHAVNVESAHDWMNAQFTPWMMRRLSLASAHSLGNLQMCLLEIYNNIADHSSRQIGCLFAQHYPNRAEISIAVSDFGVGIPSNVRRVLPTLTDSLALREAVKPGFTTRTHPHNRGVGLDVLFENVIQGGQGKVYLHAHRGILEAAQYDKKGMDYRFRDTSMGIYPGTLVEIRLNTNLIKDDLGNVEEFVW